MAELKIKFNNSCREVKRLIKKAHASYEKDLATKSKANPKLLYSYVNSQNTKKEKIRLIITAEGKKLVEGSDIVECLNSQYLDQFTRDDPACSPSRFVKSKSCATNLIETIDIVSEALNRGFTASIVFFDFLNKFYF